VFRCPVPQMREACCPSRKKVRLLSGPYGPVVTHSSNIREWIMDSFPFRRPIQAPTYASLRTCPCNFIFYSQSQRQVWQSLLRCIRWTGVPLSGPANAGSLLSVSQKSETVVWSLWARCHPLQHRRGVDNGYLSILLPPIQVIRRTATNSSNLSRRNRRSNHPHAQKSQ